MELITVSRNRLAFIMLCLACFAALAGCDLAAPDGPSVSGIITVVDDREQNESPLPDGLITWEPVGGTKGPKVSGRIQQGAYQIDASSGLQPGQYRVEVLVMPPEIAAGLNGKYEHQNHQPYREIDQRYNQRSVLTFSVVAEKENQFDAQVSYRKQ